MKVRFKLSPKSNLSIWEFPKPGEEYILGGDCSEGLEGGDYQCFQVIKRSEFKQVAVWYGMTDPIDLAKQGFMLGIFYNQALVAIEREKTGVTVLDYFRNNKYPNIYKMQKFDFTDVDATERLGWLTTGHTRSLLVDNLREIIKENSVIINDPDTLAELKTFIRNSKSGKIEASAGNHDDRVMALGIACYLHRILPFYKKNIDPSNFFEEHFGSNRISTVTPEAGELGYY